MDDPTRNTGGGGWAVERSRVRRSGGDRRSSGERRRRIRRIEDRRSVEVPVEMERRGGPRRLRARRTVAERRVAERRVLADRRTPAFVRPPPTRSGADPRG